MPLRKMDFISSVLALAEPVPLTVAILIVKSLIRLVVTLGHPRATHLALRSGSLSQAILGFCASIVFLASSSACGQWTRDFCMSQAAVGQRSAQRPQCTQRSSSLTMTRAVCGSGPDT